MTSIPTELPISGIPGFDGEQHRAMLALLADLRYPVGPGGEVLMAMDPMKPIMSYHLIRCGWRPDLTKRKIKARKVFGTGVVEDAITWVGVREPDDPLANLANMTVAEIEQLPDDLRIEALRRLGMRVEPPPGQQSTGWHTQTRIHISDEEPDELEDEEPQP